MEAPPNLDSLERVGGSDSSASSNTASDERAIYLLAMKTVLSHRVSSSHYPVVVAIASSLDAPEMVYLTRSVYGI